MPVWVMLGLLFTLLLAGSCSTENVTNKVVAWSSSDSKIASVDATGKVTAIAEGKVTDMGLYRRRTLSGYRSDR